MATFPRDQFDDIPEDLARVGAHRAPAKKGRGWVRFAWAALATGLLVVAGLFGLSRLNPDINFAIPGIGGGGGTTDLPTISSVPTVDPITDPTTIDPALGLTVSILNGSPTANLAQTAGKQLSTAGWPVGATANAATRDVTATTVYYNSADLEGYARGIALALGVNAVSLSDAYPGAPITVVLGTDYTAPKAG